MMEKLTEEIEHDTTAADENDKSKYTKSGMSVCVFTSSIFTI